MTKEWDFTIPGQQPETIDLPGGRVELPRGGRIAPRPGYRGVTRTDLEQAVPDEDDLGVYPTPPPAP